MEILIGILLVAGIIYWASRSGSKQAPKQTSQQVPKQAPRREPEPEFTFQFGGYSPRPKGRAKLEWAAAGESLQVGRYSIRNAMTYYSDGAPSANEASCINKKLKVGVPVSEPKGALGYWPQYEDITADQRANYLEWLSRGRRGALTDIGYAFIFFYGLERRVLIDNADADPILDEVLGLLDTYQHSGSFNGYLGNFVVTALCSRGLRKVDESMFQRIFLKRLPKLTDDGLRVALAWLVTHAKPMPKEIAYEVARWDGRSSRSVVLKRLPDEHRLLFCTRYETKYPNGLDLTPAKRPCRVEYMAASPTMLSYSTSRTAARYDLPDPLGRPAQFKGIIELWNEAISELKRASTQVGKGLELDSREAYEALPSEIRAQADHPDKVDWDRLVEENSKNRSFAKLPVSAIAALRSIPFRAKLTKKQSIEIAECAKMMGYALVPDPLSTQRPYTWDEKIAVLPCDFVGTQEDENAYHAATLMLELGIGMAAADGEIDRDEIVHVSRVVRKQFELKTDDARRLEAYRSLLISDPPPLTGLGKRIEGLLDPEQRVSLGRYLAGVAISDGRIDPGEKKALKRVYRAMGLPTQDAEDLLLRLATASDPDAPVTVKHTSQRPDGERIPDRESRTADLAPVSIDMRLVEEISRDTKSVAEMLGKAMGDYSPDASESDSVSTGDLQSLQQPSDSQPVARPGSFTTRTGQLEGLEERYADALSALLVKTTWAKEELKEVTHSHGVMANAFIDEVNSWAEESLGDYLIEGENPYELRMDLLETTT